MSFLAVVSFVVVITAGCSVQEESERPLDVVPSVDLQRYAGTWYEIARLANKFQRQCVSDVTATYTLLEDGDIQVVNRCRRENGEVDEAAGRAKFATENGPSSKLKVRFAPAILSFLPFVWGDYWIIDLAPDYTYAVIGEPARKYLWVLSRTPSMDESLLQRILKEVEGKGYNLATLVRTKHTNVAPAVPSEGKP